jgi:hypothetical protein
MDLSVEIMAPDALPETNTAPMSMRQQIRTFLDVQRVICSFTGLRVVY